MFTFGDFSKRRDDEIDEGHNDENYIAAKEVFTLSDNCFGTDLKRNICHFIVNEIDIIYLDQAGIIDTIKESDGTILEAEINHSDLIAGIYEGGLKIWECTYDVANYLSLQNKLTIVSEKKILDLGCGAGILGILAYKLGASEVHFQDFNESVIKYTTMPNIELNGYNLLNKSRFWAGDWGSFSTVNSEKYDIILTSETIYNKKNHKKLLVTLKFFLKPGGLIILGAKSYYFGVGGGLDQFLQLIEKDGTLSFESVWKSTEGIKRELVLLHHK